MGAWGPPTQFQIARKKMSSRNFCFTLNNYTPEHVLALNNLKCTYLVYGYETAPTTGTPHLQGYVEFNNSVRFETMKNKIAKEIHLESRKGTAAQAADYCKKGGNFYEDGHLSQQGRRGDIERAVELARSDEPRPQLTGYQELGYQAYRHLLNGFSVAERQRNWKPTVYWFYGPTGSGKSRLAEEMFPNAWWSAEDLKWWDGYDAHEDVILDELRFDHVRLSTLLRLLDRHPFRVAIKGGFRQLLAKNIVITSCFHPSRIYPNCREDIEQLLRRIDHVWEFPRADESRGIVLPPTSAATNMASDVKNF